MATRTEVILLDDLEGASAEVLADETVRFGIDGQALQIDLTARNADSLREALAPYIAAGRREGAAGSASRRVTRSAGRQTAGPVARRTELPPTPQAVRAWAQSNNVPVNARGRIPSKVYELWYVANS